MPEWVCIQLVLQKEEFKILNSSCVFLVFDGALRGQIPANQPRIIKGVAMNFKDRIITVTRLQEQRFRSE